MDALQGDGRGDALSCCYRSVPLWCVACTMSCIVSGLLQVPLWEPQYKSHSVRDILQTPPDRAAGSHACVTVNCMARIAWRTAWRMAWRMAW